MSYLFDTDICIHIIRKKPANVLHKLKQFALGEIGISSITVAELQFGVQKSQQPAQNQEALDQFLLPLAIVAFDYDAAVTYGRIRTQLERAGTPIGALDTLIAAQALCSDSILVTSNLKEFSRVPQLKVEDWINM